MHMKSRIGTIVAACLLAALVAAIGAPAWSAAPAGARAASRGTTPATASAPAGTPLKAYAFDSKEALAAWNLQGEAAVDADKSHGEKGGSLKIGPGSKAVLKLADKELSGKVELWIYDDVA
jgi:hypothetical protein